jgi:hypothetical protein
VTNTLNDLFISVKIPLCPPLQRGKLLCAKRKTPSFCKGGRGRIYKSTDFFISKKTLSTSWFADQTFAPHGETPSLELLAFPGVSAELQTVMLGSI